MNKGIKGLTFIAAFAALAHPVIAQQAPKAAAPKDVIAGFSRANALVADKGCIFIPANLDQDVAVVVVTKNGGPEPLKDLGARKGDVYFSYEDENGHSILGGPRGIYYAIQEDKDGVYSFLRLSKKDSEHMFTLSRSQKNHLRQACNAETANQGPTG